MRIVKNKLRHAANALCLVTFSASLCLGSAGAFSPSAADNTGRVEGRVTEKYTRQPLVGATLYVEETEIGATTGLQGRFMIHNVPTGKHRIWASYTGYDNSCKEVTIRPGVASRVDFTLTYWEQRPPQWPKSARLFEFGQVSFAPLAASSGLRAPNAGGSARNSFRWELGSFAYGLKLKHWPALLVGFKLAEWFDEGGTRDGQPAFLPVYVYAMHDPDLRGLWLGSGNQPGPIEQTPRGRDYLRAIRWGLTRPKLYVYAMGSASRSVGAGVGVHIPWSHAAFRRLSLRFTPGLELAWTRSWNDDFSFSRLSLSLSFGLGQWYVRPKLYIL